MRPSSKRTAFANRWFECNHKILFNSPISKVAFLSCLITAEILALKSDRISKWKPKWFLSVEFTLLPHWTNQWLVNGHLHTIIMDTANAEWVEMNGMANAYRAGPEVQKGSFRKQFGFLCVPWKRCSAFYKMCILLTSLSLAQRSPSPTRCKSLISNRLLPDDEFGD